MKYTKKMLKQDRLWQSEKEDLQVMKKLQESIIKHYRKKYDLKEYSFNTWQHEDEVLSEMVDLNGESIISVGYCKALIDEFDFWINQLKIEMR